MSLEPLRFSGASSAIDRRFVAPVCRRCYSPLCRIPRCLRATVDTEITRRDHVRIRSATCDVALTNPTGFRFISCQLTTYELSAESARQLIRIFVIIFRPGAMEESSVKKKKKNNPTVLLEYFARLRAIFGCGGFLSRFIGCRAF